ncbi:Hypothetical predicted protein, partial [Pelobates cultripes]
ENLSQTFESFKDTVKKDSGPVAIQRKQTKKHRRERSPSLPELSSGECSAGSAVLKAQSVWLQALEESHGKIR